MRIAHIKNNIVSNISIGRHANGVTTICVDNIWCDNGARYENGKFIPREITNEEILERRKESYPPLSDLADAIYWQSKGDNTKLEAYLTKCEEVKSNFPKR